MSSAKWHLFRLGLNVLRTAIGLSTSMSSIDYVISMVIFNDTVALWNFAYTDWLLFSDLVHYRSIVHNISWILFIFGTAIGLSWSIDYMVYIYLIGFRTNSLN